jgi:hypothetical protein
VEEESEGRRDVSSQHQRSKSRPLENLESAGTEVEEEEEEERVHHSNGLGGE